MVIATAAVAARPELDPAAVARSLAGRSGLRHRLAVTGAGRDELLAAAGESVDAS